jgi:Ca2+-binding RTX toxin-like protein
MTVRKWATEKLVNATMTGQQQNPAIAALADGGYVVLYETGPGSTTNAVLGQRFDAAGNKSGAEFALPATARSDGNPDVAALGDGFVVSWTYHQSGHDDILAQRYNAAGATIGGLITVAAAVDPFVDENNPGGPHNEYDAAITSYAGRFAVAYSNRNSFGTAQLRMAEYTAAGNFITTLIVGSSFPGYTHDNPDLGQLANGGFVLGWEIAAGSPVFSLFDQNGATTANTKSASESGGANDLQVTGLASGAVVVTWTSLIPQFPDPDYGIHARMFDSAGNPVGGEFVVNTRGQGLQSKPTVTALPDGGYLITWQSYAPNDTFDISGQMFDAFGGRVGGEFTINTTVSGEQQEPVVAVLADGRVAVAWTDRSGQVDTSYGAIRTQILDPRDGLVSGSGGADSLYGSNDLGDQLSGFAGGDIMRGLAGNDILYGGEGNDDAYGGLGDDVAYGGAGADVLIGEKGDDQLFGEEGNDDLRGGAGADTLDGGAGIDTANYGTAIASVRAALDGSLAGLGDAAGDVFAGVEYLRGADIAGSGDTLRGEGGANAIYGNAGNDNLNGMAGHDKLVGGLGTDTLTGGAGNDQFIYNLLSELPDSLTDFSSNAAGNNDVFLFKGSVFGGLPSGALPAAQFQSSTAATAANGTVRFFYETDTRILRFDADGSGGGSAPMVIATLQVGATMTFSDISIF